MSNNCGVDGAGLGLLLEQRRISRVIASYVGENKEFARQYLAGELTVELTPQGTLAERMRAGGAGIGASSPRPAPAPWWPRAACRGATTPHGTVALASEPKEVRSFHGRDMVLEESHRRRRGTGAGRSRGPRPATASSMPSARNFNVPAAMCGRLTIVEAESVVEVGELLDPTRCTFPASSCSGSSS